MPCARPPSPSQVIIHEKSFSHLYFCVKHKIILSKTLMGRNPWTFSYWFGGSCYYSHLYVMFKFPTILFLKITDQSTHSLQSLPKNNRQIKSHVWIQDTNTKLFWKSVVWKFDIWDSSLVVFKVLRGKKIVTSPCGISTKFVFFRPCLAILS